MMLTQQDQHQVDCIKSADTQGAVQAQCNQYEPESFEDGIDDFDGPIWDDPLDADSVRRQMSNQHSDLDENTSLPPKSRSDRTSVARAVAHTLLATQDSEADQNGFGEPLLWQTPSAIKY